MDTAFFARIVRTGTVLGAHPGMTSGEVEWILGDDHSWDEDGDTLTWDYGLVTFVWHKEAGQRFAVRTKHLTFRLPFDDLRAAVAVVGTGPPVDGVQEYLHPDTGVVVRVDLATGDVHEIVGGPRDSRELPEPRDMPKVHTSPVFFADIVQTGTVLGVDAELQPEAVRRVLGEPEYTNETTGGLSWGYGLMELFWSAAAPGGARWTYHFSVQAHRLRWPRRTVRFADLRTELDRRGIDLVELASTQPDPEYAEYWYPRTRVVVIVYVPDDQVYQVQSRFRTDYSAPSPHANHRTVLRSIKEVVNLSDKARRAWIERHKPAEHPERWWLEHCRQISACSAESDDPKWLTFALWAWAQPMGIAPADHAWEMAAFTRSVEHHLPTIARPPADAVVRACLAEITGTTSPLDKTLISAAEQHRHAVEDPELLAELDRWIEARADIPRASMPDL